MRKLYFYSLGAGSKLLNFEKFIFHMRAKIIRNFCISTFNYKFHDDLPWSTGKAGIPAGLIHSRAREQRIFITPSPP